MAFSTEFRNRLLTWALRPTEAVTRPSALYAALYSAVTGPESGTEVSGAGYARVDVTSVFGPASAGVVASSVTVLFGTGPSGGNWTVNGVALMDAESGGNLVTEIQETDSEVIVNDGDGAPGFEVGDMIARLLASVAL